MTTLIGIADDHFSFLQSISLLLDSSSHMKVVIKAHDGQELLDQLALAPERPGICLVDIHMPRSNGPATVERLSRDYPAIKTIALSMEHDDTALIGMLRAGCLGWWLKFLSPDELVRTIHEVDQYGFYNADPLNIYYRQQPGYHEQEEIELTGQERRLLQLYCMDLTEQEVHTKMGVPDQETRVICSGLYEKLHVRSRPGAVMEAFHKGLVDRNLD
ncbi:MAG: response regulator transcription factor [Chitinophagaceae bacterium]|nr:response regulator transcription factor [Chitinophagaceae bacterium]